MVISERLQCKNWVPKAACEFHEAIERESKLMYLVVEVSKDNEKEEENHEEGLASGKEEDEEEEE